MKLLIVEDNQDMREGLVHFFDREGFDVDSVSTCEDGIDRIDEQTYNICIIDINLPAKSGYDLIEYIRSEGYDMPLIAMTARDSIEDKLKGFDLGLTDYIVKPFDRKEILARVDAHLQRSRSNNSQVIKTSNLAISPKSFTFKAYNKDIDLTKIEFRMMTMLMQNNNNVVQNEDLISYVWSEQAEIINPPLRIHIANLRKKIGDTDFKVIKTVPAVGYILND